MKRIGGSARWADLTIRLVVKANSMSARKLKSYAASGILIATANTHHLWLCRYVSRVVCNRRDMNIHNFLHDPYRSDHNSPISYTGRNLYKKG